MGVASRLKITLAVLSVAFILKMVIFFSPGWAIVNIQFPERIAGDLMEESFEEINSKDHKPGDPVAMPYDKEGIVEGHRLSISMGLWYFVTCVYYKQPRSMFYRKECFHSTYSSAEEEMKNLPKNSPYVRGTYQKIHCKCFKIHFLSNINEAKSCAIFKDFPRSMLIYKFTVYTF